MNIFRRNHEGLVSGDAIPLYHNGVFHIFYLTSPPNTVNWPERIRTTWQHAITKDLINWQELEPALVPGEGNAIDKDGCWTGSAIYANGKFHIFYTAADLDSKYQQKIVHAVSDDGISFVKETTPCIVADADYYETVDWRDPYVFYNEEDACYWILIAGRKNNGPDTRRGCIVLYKSQDLYKWKHYGPIYDPGYTNVTECPEMFKMGEYWYISHSRFSESGGTVYRYSKSPYGPWRTPKYDGIGGRRFYAAKSAANDEGRRFYFGWVHERATPDDKDHWCWGGDFCIPHEIVQRTDGQLDFKMPEEFNECFTERVDSLFKRQQGDININDGSITVDSIGKMSFGFFDIKEAKYRFRCTLTMDDCRDSVGIILKSNEELSEYYLLSLEFPMQRVSLTKFPVPMDPYWAAASVAVKDFSMAEVDGPRVCEKSFNIENNQAINLDIVVENGIMEMFIDDKVTFTFRCYRDSEYEIGLLVQDGKGKFDNIVFQK